jgi:hypothetical protein
MRDTQDLAPALPHLEHAKAMVDQQAEVVCVALQLYGELSHAWAQQLHHHEGQEVQLSWVVRVAALFDGTCRVSTRAHMGLQAAGQGCEATCVTLGAGRMRSV